jgi:hypothetical protein
VLALVLRRKASAASRVCLAGSIGAWERARCGRRGEKKTDRQADSVQSTGEVNPN